MTIESRPEHLDARTAGGAHTTPDTLAAVALHGSEAPADPGLKHETSEVLDLVLEQIRGPWDAWFGTPARMRLWAPIRQEIARDPELARALLNAPDPREHVERFLDPERVFAVVLDETTVSAHRDIVAQAVPDFRRRTDRAADPVPNQEATIALLAERVVAKCVRDPALRHVVAAPGPLLAAREARIVEELRAATERYGALRLQRDAETVAATAALGTAALRRAVAVYATDGRFVGDDELLDGIAGASDVETSTDWKRNVRGLHRRIARALLAERAVALAVLPREAAPNARWNPEIAELTGYSMLRVARNIWESHRRRTPKTTLIVGHGGVRPGADDPGHQGIEPARGRGLDTEQVDAQEKTEELLATLPAEQRVVAVRAGSGEVAGDRLAHADSVATAFQLDLLAADLARAIGWPAPSRRTQLVIGTTLTYDEIAAQLVAEDPTTTRVTGNAINQEWRRRVGVVPRLRDHLPCRGNADFGPSLRALLDRLGDEG